MLRKNLTTLLVSVSSVAVILVAANLFSKEDTKKPEIPKEMLAYGGFGKGSSCGCSGKDLSNTFISVTKDTKPAVVNVRAEATGENQGYLGDRHQPFDFFSDDFFNQFFGSPFKQQQNRSAQPQVSQGSGFIISQDGYVMTNFHVVKGANKLVVTIDDGYEKEYAAELIGGDPFTDVAVLKIVGDNFPYLNFGDSANVQEGELVIAIGNPFQLKSTVTVGVISAKGRQELQINDLEDFIQTDAAINPGNSGGPLIDLDGNVIGMNTAIVSKSGGYMGIGFAIPTKILMNIRDQLIANGEVNRGFLGVSLQPIDKDLADAFSLNKPEGALVSDVMKNSPAYKAGLMQGDIIIEVNGIPVKSPSNLRNEILLMQPGTTVNLVVLRQGKSKKIAVTLGAHGETSPSGASAGVQKLGLELEELTPDKARSLGYASDQDGLFVRSIKRGSIAEKAGIPAGSILLAINHTKVSSVDELNEALDNVKDPNRVLVLINYKGQMRFFSLKLS